MRKLACITLFLSVCLSGFADTWTGAWHRNGLFDSADIVITSEKAEGFHFSITAFFGAFKGEFEGAAVINGNTARATLENEEVLREAFFQQTKAGIILTTKNCNHYYGGESIDFSGTFTREAVPLEKLAEEHLEKLVEKKESAGAIKMALGPDFVEMVSCLQFVTEEECLDDFEASVFSGCVIGICFEMAAIVMYTDDFKLYISWRSKGQSKYYSSDPVFLHQYPKTITEWAKQLEEMKEMSR